MKDNYGTYALHYQRMLNERPSIQFRNFDFDRYLHARPWLAGIDYKAPILDVGCGFGQQLFIFKKLGFTNLFGIEITNQSLQIAAEELGAEVKLELVDAFDFLQAHKNCFAAITCNDVLEHIPRENTIHLLALINESLTPDGVISLRVPNMSSLLSAYSMYLDFTHLTGFTEFSLMQVLDLAGFADHQLLRPRRELNFKGWRPWRPLRGLGILGHIVIT